MTDRKLVKKLAKVMSEVKYIKKNGFNKFNNYSYATESDVAEKVREVLADQQVIMLPDVVEHSTREHVNRKGNTEYIATVKVKFTFIDGETGEELSIHSAGEGQDAGDKAVYKAITGAQKYALMKAFMIPTGDDPEGDNGVDERNNEKQTQSFQTQGKSQNKSLSDAQVKRLFAIAKSVNVTTEQVKKIIMRDYKKTEVAQLTRQEYDVICKNLEELKQGAAN